MEYFICLGKDSQKLFVQQPCQNIIQNLLERTRERASYKDFRLIDFVERTKNVTSEELLKRKLVYHEGCYSSFANIANLNCVKKRFSTSIDTVEYSIVKRKQKRSPKAANNDTTQMEISNTISG